ETISQQLDKDIVLLMQMYKHLMEIVDTTHDLADVSEDTTVITDEIRDHISDFVDFFRPLKSYFYWERHCYDIPICFALRSTWDSLDGIDKLSQNLHKLSDDINRLDFLLPQVVELLPAVVDTLQLMHSLV